jgi:hypothetical protein
VQHHDHDDAVPDHNYSGRSSLRPMPVRLLRYSAGGANRQSMHRWLRLPQPNSALQGSHLGEL